MLTVPKFVCDCFTLNLTLLYDSVICICTIQEMDFIPGRHVL